MDDVFVAVRTAINCTFSALDSSGQFRGVVADALATSARRRPPCYATDFIEKQAFVAASTGTLYCLGGVVSKVVKESRGESGTAVVVCAN